MSPRFLHFAAASVILTASSVAAAQPAQPTPDAPPPPPPPGAPDALPPPALPAPRAPVGATDWGSPPPPLADGGAEAPLPGVTAKGLPLAQRGGVRADVAGLVSSENRGDAPLASVDVVAEIPLANRRLMLDLRLPLGFGALGNPTVGMHYVARPAERFWVTAGGAIGFPLINNEGMVVFAFSRAFWDVHQFLPYTVPIVPRLAFEGHASIVEMRAYVEPVVGLPISSRVEPHFILQHAAEIQIGHSIGGGVRYQGVAFVTKSNPLDDDDRYQGALEPYFALRRELVTMRLGLLMPLDGELGGPFAKSWGVRGSVGIGLD